MKEQCTTCKFSTVGTRVTKSRGELVPTIACAWQPARVDVSPDHWCGQWVLKPDELPPANPPVRKKAAKKRLTKQRKKSSNVD